MPTVQLFQINEGEWWVGASLPEVIDAAVAAGRDASEVMRVARPVTEGEMASLQVVMEDFSITFQEGLHAMIEFGEPMPCVFAVNLNG